MIILAIIQVLYLVVNAIGLMFGFLWYFDEFEYSTLDRLFTKVAARCGKFGLGIFGFLFITLFIPAITVLASFAVLLVIFGTGLED